MRKRTALYCRISTPDGRQDNQNQLRALRQYAIEQGWEIVGEYMDERSGRRADRPQFLKVMQDAKRGRFDVLLFWSLDRLSREGALKTLHTLHQLSLSGVKFRSMQEPYLDSLGAFGEPIVALISQIALMESQRIGARIRAGVARAKAEGIRFGRPRLEINRDAMISMRQSGASLRQIAKAHNCSVPTVTRTLAQAA
jgi:DNA invertase Pin-like site-specific DNA recombinase